MQPGPASGHIHAARAIVRQAAQICEKANLELLNSAPDLLQAAASEMRLAEAAIRAGSSGERAEPRQEAGLLKRELSSMMRVADGCSGVLRGLAVRLGCAAVTYTPQGRASAPSPSAAAYEVQG